MLPLPPGARDRSPLWKDFAKPGFERPFMVTTLFIGIYLTLLFSSTESLVLNGQFQEPKLLMDLISLDPLCPNQILKQELLQ